MNWIKDAPQYAIVVSYDPAYARRIIVTYYGGMYSGLTLSDAFERAIANNMA